MRNDLPKAITAEDVIRRFDLNSLVQNRKEIKENKLGLDKTENILYKFIDSTLKGMTDTEDQVDGKITTWFFNGIPTLLNEPASNWTDDKTKNSHIGDLYYDKTNGNTYIFTLNEDTYSWIMVDDDNINEAMALANSNPDTSDGYRNIFVIDPIAPYEVGDIWIKSNGEVYRCIVARESGNLNEAEWTTSDKYTNDNYTYDARAILDQFTEFITANYVCKVLVKTTKDSIELSVSSATTKITNDYTTAISESEGRAEIRENQVLLSANRYTTGEIARVEGEIGDIADITQTEESEYAGVNFTNVPESEPINISIHPINENLSYLYPYTTKNLFNKDSGFRNGYINASGNFVSENVTAVFNQYIQVEPNTEYTYSTNRTTYNKCILFYDENKTFISRNVKSSVSTSVVTTPANCKYIVLQFSYNGTTTMTQEIIDSVNVQLEKGNTATTYETYNTGLYPSSTLYPKSRTLRFINTSDYEVTQDTKYTNYRKYYSLEDDVYTLLIAGTDYTIGDTISGTIYQNPEVDYELPEDLLYYDADNYDLLELDYASQIVKVTKKCKYNANGSVGLLDNPEIHTNYPYPSIQLTLGNYEIKLLGYTSGYIFIRLMSNNVYAGQFVTKTQLNGTISVLPHQIDLTTAELVSGTQCGITIKLRDANGNEIDSKDANITLSGKVAFDDLSQSGRTTINGSNITTGTIDASQVNVTNINATNITSGTLKSSNYSPNASGTSINLSTGVIDTKNFKVTSDGSITATNASISGSINATSGNIGGCSISGGSLQVSNAHITDISANKINSGQMSANYIKGGTIDATNVTINNLNASKITSGTLNGNNVNVTNLNASNITGGTLDVDRIQAKSINGTKIADLGITNAKIANTTIVSGKINPTNFLLSNDRGAFDLKNGIVRCFNSNGGSMILSNAARLSATAGIGISSNSTGNISAPEKNIDIKGCSGATVYIGCMGNASGTTEKSCISVENGAIKLRGNYLQWNGSTKWDSSSKKTKTKIKKVTNAEKEELYDLVKNIPIRKYDYKEKYGGKKNNYGFLIEDIEKTKLNDILHVTQSEKDKNYKTYSSEDLTRIELVIIQELMNKVEKLEKEIKKYKDKNKEEKNEK